MAGKPQYKNPPATPMNQWVRDALSHADMGFPDAAEKMAALLGRTFDRSIIQKMTVKRKVTALEASALAKLTGYPLPHEIEVEAQIAKYLALDPENRRAADGIIDRLYAAQPTTDPGTD